MQYDSDIYTNVFDFSNMATLPFITPPDAIKVDNSLLVPSNILDHHDILPTMVLVEYHGFDLFFWIPIRSILQPVNLTFGKSHSKSQAMIKSLKNIFGSKVSIVPAWLTIDLQPTKQFAGDHMIYITNFSFPLPNMCERFTLQVQANRIPRSMYIQFIYTLF